MHHDLRSLIDHREAVVTLDYSPRARHLRAFGIRDVALLLVARRAFLLLPLLEECLDLIHLPSIRLDLLRVLGSVLAVLLLPVTRSVPLDDALGHTLQLLPLLVELPMRATPLLRRIGRQFAPIDREVLPS